MPVTVRGTDILFNNSTTQSTAATTYAPAYGAVGSCVIGASTSFTGFEVYPPGTTVAGSTLRTYDVSPVVATINAGFSGAFNPGLSGTWVACMRFYSRNEYTGSQYTTLWMRIS
jgi:hypothetical protein